MGQDFRVLLHKGIHFQKTALIHRGYHNMSSKNIETIGTLYVYLSPAHRTFNILHVDGSIPLLEFLDWSDPSELGVDRSMVKGE